MRSFHARQRHTMQYAPHTSHHARSIGALAKRSPLRLNTADSTFLSRRAFLGSHQHGFSQSPARSLKSNLGQPRPGQIHTQLLLDSSTHTRTETHLWIAFALIALLDRQTAVEESYSKTPQINAKAPRRRSPAEKCCRKEWLGRVKLFLFFPTSCFKSMPHYPPFLVCQCAADNIVSIEVATEKAGFGE